MNSEEKLTTEQQIHKEMERSAFYELLYVDAVSGAHNRRYYEDHIRRSVTTGGMAMIDLDDFKFSNDAYGHAVGDMLLERVVSVIRRSIRKTDQLIRYGGDEFLLLIPDISEESFEEKLWEIQHKIYAEHISDCRELHLSVSIGGVMLKEQTVEKMISRADRMMYQAKKQKNTVVTEGNRYRQKKEKLGYGADQGKRQQILIVDDSQMNREILCEMLKSEFDIIEAADGAECMNILEKRRNEIALVLLDIIMPVMDGYEVLGQMNRREWIEQLPVIMISSEDSPQAIRRVYEMGVTDYISRPFDAKVVYRRVTNTMKLYAKQRYLTNVLTEQIREKEESRKIMVAILSQIVEFRNGESGLHVQHINRLTELLLNRLLLVTEQYKISQSDRELIVMASSLHDIGKIGVSEKILNKPGRLTLEEYEEMKTHTLVAASILENLKLYQNSRLVKIAYEICRWHHERYDGKGYPDGLKGEEIPISAQIVSVADVYDALVSKRVYKEPYSHDEAMKMILSGECGSFNTLLLKCMEDVEEEIKEIYLGEE